jgi:RNase P/RNase MRP subunit p30
MKKSIVKGRDIAFNRKALENKKTSMLILSHKGTRDRLKQRDSGLNQVLCKIAKENDVTLAFDLDELRGDKKQKAKLLSRMLQNIKLIKKYKNKFLLINYKNKKQAFSFLISLGLPTDMAKKALH